jgi:Glycosyl transferase family 2
MKCCICGAVRNVGKYLDKIFYNMEKIGSLFEDYVIIIYYDESNDDTLQKLKNYRAINPKLNFYVNKTIVSNFRTQRIANARNGCLQMIRANYSDYEMFVMMDCDEVCSPDVKLNVLKKYLYKNSWDSLSFNRSEYYDIWALSIRPYMFSYRHHKNENAVLNSMKTYIKDLLSKVPENGLLKCASAFNGFAIYRTDKFLNCNYDGKVRLDLIPKNYIYNNVVVNGQKIEFKTYAGTEQSFHEDCEHRSFHLEAINKNGSRIRISPEILFN